MSAKSDLYLKFQSKIRAMKDTYPSLRTKSDSFVFSALCVKSHLYKNPALGLEDCDFEEIVVDGQYDGGVDILLTDPNSEDSDMVIAQSKFYTNISADDVTNAMIKMASFYKDMSQGHYEQVNKKVQQRFLTLNAELSEESKIHFVFYTSAPRNHIRQSSIEKKFRECFTDSNRFEVSFFFNKEIEEAIDESESRRPDVEQGKIKIDSANNYLLYENCAAIVNVSAFSIKMLYAQYNIQLLAKNLRYHIAGRDIDGGIEKTIKNEPETFWLKNNGITMICNDFDIDGREVKLRNFSIINGGQTAYMLHKSHDINENRDLFLPCKIIKIVGETEDERNAFSLAIAKATNTQKPIKSVDLKANSPEQIRFSQSMRDAGIFYQTKRGEVVPKDYKEAFLNSSLVEIRKLGLAAIFQLPCASRAKPSSLYLPKYYEKLFNANQQQIAKLCKELLYIDYYFRKLFQKKFDKENASVPASENRTSFAHNARTICIAFVAFASRYYQKNIQDQDLEVIFNAAGSDNTIDSQLYDIFSNLEGISYFIPPEVFRQKDQCDEILDRLFKTIIEAGYTYFSTALNFDPNLTPTNFLKKDKNYYLILKNHWTTIRENIQQIFGGIMKG